MHFADLNLPRQARHFGTECIKISLLCHKLQALEVVLPFRVPSIRFRLLPFTVLIAAHRIKCKKS